jgi:hypothetical protein
LRRVVLFATEHVRLGTVSKAKLVDHDEGTKGDEANEGVAGEQVESLLQSVAEVSQLLFLQARVHNEDEDGRRNFLRVELILDSRVLFNELGGKVRL